MYGICTSYSLVRVLYHNFCIFRRKPYMRICPCCLFGSMGLGTRCRIFFIIVMVTGDELYTCGTVHYRHSGINPAELVHPCPFKFDTRSYLNIHRSLTDILQLFWRGFMGMRACPRRNEDNNAGMLTSDVLHELFLRQNGNGDGEWGSPVISRYICPRLLN